MSEPISAADEAVLQRRRFPRGSATLALQLQARRRLAEILAGSA